MYLLEMNHIQKKFGELSVLRDISLAVKEGEIVSIIGPSGSGKSTLLRCATMLETIDSGEIVYLGEKAAWTEGERAVYARKDKLRQIQKSYGLVFQSFNLFPHFSVIKNITDAPIHVQGKSREQAMEEGMALLRQMGLEDKADAYPCQLSGGQRQRVAIARALANEPPLILADEPTGNLDTAASQEIMELFAKLHDGGTTVVVVTHEEDIAAFTGRIIRFRDGQIISDEANPCPRRLGGEGSAC